MKFSQYSTHMLIVSNIIILGFVSFFIDIVADKYNNNKQRAFIAPFGVLFVKNEQKNNEPKKLNLGWKALDVRLKLFLVMAKVLWDTTGRSTPFVWGGCLALVTGIAVFLVLSIHTDKGSAERACQS